MTDRFTEVQPGQPSWYWHHDRVVEVVRDGSGTLWTRWEDGQRTATGELPEGPRCVRPAATDQPEDRAAYAATW